MSDNIIEQPAASKTPSLVAYNVLDHEGGDIFRTCIGSACANYDGKASSYRQSTSRVIRVSPMTSFNTILTFEPKKNILTCLLLFISALKAALCRSQATVFMAAIALVCVLNGCAADLPISRQVSHDPLLERQGGVLLLVDASVQINELVGEDYFVINEAKSGGQAAITSLHKYIEDSSIPIRGEVVSVCALRLNTNNSSISVAEIVGGEKRMAQQPLWVSESITNDHQYISALGAVSTYVFEHAAISSNNPKAGDNASSANNAPPITMDDFRKATEIIKEKTHASSVLFLGVLGKSRSSAKVAVQNLAGFTVGMGTAIATAGLGKDVYGWVIPGHELDGILMKGALIDLESSQLTWSNTVQASEDPINPKNMANENNLDLLFRNMMYNHVFVQPVPSSNP